MVADPGGLLGEGTDHPSIYAASIAIVNLFQAGVRRPREELPIPQRRDDPTLGQLHAGFSFGLVAALVWPRRNIIPEPVFTFIPESPPRDQWRVPAIN